ncbi:30S ribosome-binding factor RbfA [Bifidobacterium simiarum]|uniref:Ribosome-binding factor A n=1 Tax=Bifidobacterium simiarum TaxID=2045441 RepID=A0A2M9HFL4_9BIFI|nr:30S ribosome-binding factor RbfA [Bifidobacterium simiarum]PJM75576.1 ribosome-binding factor A [Bifidobacterium simiarum]
MAGTNPRAVRIAGLIKRVVAQALERELHDPRLDNVTITDVRVTNDMQLARIFWTQLGTEGKAEGQRKRANQALNKAKGHLRSLVGRKAGLRLTPVLEFKYDEVPGEATEIEDILSVALKRDRELAKARENAQYAGEADPYRHDDEERDDQADDSRDVLDVLDESGDHVGAETADHREVDPDRLDAIANHVDESADEVR